MDLCEGISPVTGELPHKEPVTRRKASICWRDHESTSNVLRPQIPVL